VGRRGTLIEAPVALARARAPATTSSFGPCRGGQAIRVRDVVAGADEGQSQACEPAEALAQGEEADQSLARVMPRRERVDDRHGRRASELLEQLVGPRPDDDGGRERRERPRGVDQRLTARELSFRRGDGRHGHSQPLRSRRKGQPRPRRWKLDDRNQRLIAPFGGESAWVGFRLGRELEHALQLGRRQICGAQHVPWPIGHRD
jgi:hypothetical protein